MLASKKCLMCQIWLKFKRRHINGSWMKVLKKCLATSCQSMISKATCHWNTSITSWWNQSTTLMRRVNTTPTTQHHYTLLCVWRTMKLVKSSHKTCSLVTSHWWQNKVRSSSTVRNVLLCHNLCVRLVSITTKKMTRMVAHATAQRLFQTVALGWNTKQMPRVSLTYVSIAHVSCWWQNWSVPLVSVQILTLSTFSQTNMTLWTWLWKKTCTKICQILVLKKRWRTSTNVYVQVNQRQPIHHVLCWLPVSLIQSVMIWHRLDVTRSTKNCH